MAPRYKVLADTFIEPVYIRSGSIIETPVTPGNHLQPLNEEAKAQMEVWYNEDAPEVDEKGTKTGKMYKPHMKFRNEVFEPGKPQTAVLLAGPPKDLEVPGMMSLGEANITVSSRVTDQRPGPLDQYKNLENPLLESPGTLEDGTKVVHSAPAPKISRAA